MKWTEEAEKSIARIPFFVRKRVRKRVEQEASDCGATEVTTEHVRSTKEKFLNRMEDEVRGFQVESCFGQGGCPNRAVTGNDLPERIEKQLSKRDLKGFLKEKVNGPLKMHHEFRVSISDCPNACSRPQIADLGLIGASRPVISPEPCSECGECVKACREDAILLKDGAPVVDESRCLYCGKCISTCPTGTLREGEKGYRILMGGKLGRHPRLGTELKGIYDAGETLKIIDMSLDHYQDSCRKGERFGEVLENTGMEWIDKGKV